MEKVSHLSTSSHPGGGDAGHPAWEGPLTPEFPALILTGALLKLGLFPAFHQLPLQGLLGSRAPQASLCRHGLWQENFLSLVSDSQVEL